VALPFNVRMYVKRNSVSHTYGNRVRFRSFRAFQGHFRAVSTRVPQDRKANGAEQTRDKAPRGRQATVLAQSD